MSGQTNSTSNLLVFNLPIDLFTEATEKKWMPVIKKNRMLYSTVGDFINSSIKDITLPGLSFETSKQTIKFGKKIDWKSAQNINDIHVRQLDITFKSLEAHLSYMILSDIIRNEFLDTSKAFTAPLTVLMVDRTKDLILAMTFKEVVFNSLSEMKLAYNDYDNSEKTYSIQFTYNFVEYNYSFEKIDLNNTIDDRNGPAYTKLN